MKNIKIDAIKVPYKGKKVFINRNLLYDLSIKNIPAFEDSELKIPFKIREKFFSSKKIDVFIPSCQLINYL